MTVEQQAVEPEAVEAGRNYQFRSCHRDCTYKLEAAGLEAQHVEQQRLPLLMD